ncbi:microtubule/calcium-binding protein [Aureobasidium pullulans]|nr:microtubule/calcium-binding protein [Aureobasidium pullulans]
MLKQHGLLRRLTSRVGGGMDGKKRAKRCAKQRVEDFATRISQVLAANSAGTGAVGAQAPRFPDRAQREEARRQFSRSLRRKTERKEGTREQKHPWHPTPERTAIFFLSSYFSFPSTNQTHTQPPPICLSTSGDEMISDSYDIKLVDGAVYEVDCANITIGNDNIDIGANPSAEDGGDEGADDTAETAIDVVHSFRLVKTSFDKKSYMGYLKQYIKKVKEHMKSRDASEDEIKEFEAGVKAYVSRPTFKKFEYDFYTGESMDPDGMLVLLDFRDDGITPYCVFWKHGLSEMKV